MFVKAEKVSKIYRLGKNETKALNEVSFDLKEEKSTL